MTGCVRLQLIPYSRHINRVVQHRTVALAKARGLLPAKQEVPHPSRSNVFGARTVYINFDFEPPSSSTLPINTITYVDRFHSILNSELPAFAYRQPFSAI